MKNNIADKIRAILDQDEPEAPAEDAGEVGDMEITAAPAKGGGQTSKITPPGADDGADPMGHEANKEEVAANIGPGGDDVAPEPVASLIPEDFDAPAMDNGQIRDASIAKHMDNDSYESWQPPGDPWKYELYAGTGIDDTFLVATSPKTGKPIKMTMESHPEMFKAIIATAPSYPGEDEVDPPDVDFKQGPGDVARVMPPMEIKGDPNSGIDFKQGPGDVQDASAVDNQTVSSEVVGAIEEISRKYGVNPEDIFEEMSRYKAQGKEYLSGDNS